MGRGRRGEGGREPHAAPPPGGQARREARLRQEALAELVLVRHGEPDWMAGGKLVSADVGLTRRGHLQAEAAGEQLRGRGFDACYASPLRRAQQTAAVLTGALGLSAVTVGELAEIRVQMTGLEPHEVDRYFRDALRRPLCEHWGGWPGGESFHAFHARVTAAFAKILARHGMHARRDGGFTVWTEPPRRQRIAIVAHAGTNAVLLAHLLGVPPVPWEWMRFETELAAYSAVQARPLGLRGLVWSLQSFNEVAHLMARGLR